ncbi:MAG: DUF484 family protein [Alphaproteobacteria bacterium]|nr:DUF484 family protein [Alphaproteobacteria bacterium]
MSDQQPAAALRPDVSAADVADYLARNPEFLAQHADLLHDLTPPASRHGRGVLDFQRFVVERLQGDLGRMKRAHEEIIAASRANVASQGRIHTTVLAMLGARTLEHLIEIVTVDLALHLEVDTVVLGFESLDRAPINAAARGLRLWPKGRIDGWIPPARDVLLLGPVVADAALFGAAAPLVKSQALMRLQLKREAPAGLLALGARDSARFGASQGTELLGFLARALELTFRGWLDR